MRFLLLLAFLALAALPVRAQSTFDATGKSFNFSGGTVSGSGVNSSISFANVVTVGGTQIDAKVTLTALSGATMSTFDSSTSPYAETTFLQPNLNISSVGGYATFRIEFLRAGQPVTLQNFYVNTYDLDGAGAASAGRQYTDFTGFASYALSNPTLINRQSIAGGTRFITTVGGNQDFAVGSNDFNKIRARVFYTSASSVTVSVGDAGATGLAYFALDFSQGYAFSNIAADSQAPIVTAGQTYSYAENQTQGTTLATVAATDAVGVVAYRFADTASATSADGLFTIDGTGAIALTAAGAAAAANDYEVAPNQFIHAVQAADAAGNWSAAENVTLNVTDLADAANAPPAFTGTTTDNGTQVYAFAYAEGATTSTPLGTVTASDPEGGSVTYAISAGNADGWFGLDPATGILSLTAAGVASRANDYEQTANSHSLTVTASDGTATTSITVTLTETDIPDSADAAPSFTGTTTVDGTEVYDFTHDEGTDTSTPLGTLSALDPEGRPLTFSIVAGNADGWYVLDPATGVLTFSPAGAASLANDFEQSPNRRSLTASVSDGTSATTIPVILTERDLNDTVNAAPVFAGTTRVGGTDLYDFTHPEGSTLATVLGTLAATDPDGDPLTFSITAGNDDGWYRLDPTTAVLTLTEAGVASLANDFERMPNSQSLTVSVSDGVNSTAVTVRLTETNQDDTAPVLTGPDGHGGQTSSGAFAAVVPEGTTDAARIRADEPLQGWTLGGDDAGQFAIDADGRVTFTLPPDYEAPADADRDNLYRITITARDLAGNVTQQTLSVTVTQVFYPGEPLPAADDQDQDGTPDTVESAMADRDADGIPDAQDYDPQGYFYCRADGRILTGGRVSVTGPGTVTMVKDGAATGEYQWFVDRPGTYVMSIDTAGMDVTTLSRPSAGTLVLASQPGNPIVIGATEDGSTGQLGAFNGAPYDPDLPTAYFTQFTIAEGDPNLFGNNIPFEGCALSSVTVQAVQGAREPDMGGGQPGIFRVTLGAVSALDTVVSFTLSGTATNGTDYDGPAGTVTIPAGQLSADLRITPHADDIPDGGETVQISLIGVTGNSATRLAGTPTASLIIADDLMDEVQAPLKAILQEDFARTLGQQSTHFAHLSKGALSRLHDAGQDGCAVAVDAALAAARIRFAPGQATLATESAAALDALADSLSRCALRRFQIGVHATDLATDDANLRLSTDRALALRMALIARGIAPDRLTAKGHGATTAANDITLTEQPGGRAADSEPCGGRKVTARDGTIDAGASGLTLQGEIAREGIDCATGERVLSFGSISLTDSDSLGLQGMLLFTQARERQNANALHGRFWGGYLSRTAVSAPDAAGSILGAGLHGGIYGAVGLGTGLFLDYYAAGALGRHSFDLRLANRIDARGRYTYAALFAGAALSGERDLGRVTLRPRIGLDLGYGIASTADVTVQDLTGTAMGLLALDPVLGLRLYAETAFLSDERPVSPNLRRDRIELTPRLFCEGGFGSASRDCGIGFALDYRSIDPDLTTWSFGLDLQSTDTADSLAVTVARVRPIRNGTGTITTSLDVDGAGNPTLHHALDLRW